MQSDHTTMDDSSQQEDLASKVRELEVLLEKQSNDHTESIREMEERLTRKIIETTNQINESSEDISYDETSGTEDEEKGGESLLRSDQIDRIDIYPSTYEDNLETESLLDETPKGSEFIASSIATTPPTTSPEFNNDDPEMTTVSLKKDTYSMMMLSPFRTKSWFFGTMLFILQLLLFSMILTHQIREGRNSSHFNVPVTVTFIVRFGQFLAILALFMLQDDIADAIRMITIFVMANEIERNSNYESITGMSTQSEDTDSTKSLVTYWSMFRYRVLLPNICKFIQGSLALATSFILVITSSDLVELFKDFAALSIISYLDDVTYKLCDDGVFGPELQIRAEEVEKKKFRRRRKYYRKFPLQTIMIGTVLIVMYGFMIVFVRGQITRSFFQSRYPKCGIVDKTDIDKVQDGKCDGGVFNTIGCEFDGGDCINFNLAYPICDAFFPETVGDGICQPENNNTNCAHDGGDCCPKDGRLGDMKCNSGAYNTEECEWDKGDCIEFNRNFPGCIVEDPFRIGDGFCDGHLYFKPECRFDNGDCEGCNVSNLLLLGNNICDGPEYNTPECSFDSGDCDEFNQIYPGCDVPKPILIGNGICDGKEYNVEACDYDGKDCIEFNYKFPGCFIDEPELIGNGECNPEYNISECDFDNGDCCDVKNVFWLGNGMCDSGEYNTPQCLFDNGDCVVSGFPDCRVPDPSRINDRMCDGGVYNVESCGWDGGDCILDDFPDCHVDFPERIGNKKCDGELYNIEACGYDDGDCTVTGYPDCHVNDPSLISNNECDGGMYNTFECGYDGQDCDFRPPTPSPSYTPTQSPTNTPAAANIKVTYYEVKSWMNLPNDGLKSLEPYKEGYVDTINFQKTSGEFADSGRSDNVAVLFEGYLNFPSKGVYSICITSDDGSKLYIDNELKADNDGIHGDKTVCANIDILSPRVHQVTIEYFERTGYATIIVSWLRPNDLKSDVIPSEAWVPDPATTPTTSPDTKSNNTETAIIDNGTIMLGVHGEGHLNAGGGSPDAHQGVTVVGLRFFRDGGWYESTSFGLPAEGYGISASRISTSTSTSTLSSDGSVLTSSDIWGGANANTGIDNIVKQSFTSDGVEATSIVVVDGDLRLTHVFKPSPSTDNLYEVAVTFENLQSTLSLTNLRYRRIMDWDVPPSPYSECVSIFFNSVPSSLEYVTDDGFEGTSPLIDVSSSGIDHSCSTSDSATECSSEYDLGPSDHGALFQFLFRETDGSLKTLGPGEKFSFDLFFGGAANKEDADKALAAVGAEIATFGYPPTSFGCSNENPGTPNVFMIGFRGVGGNSVGTRVLVFYYVSDPLWTLLPSSGLSSLVSYKSEYVATIDFSSPSSEFAGSGRSNDVAALFQGRLYFSSPGIYSLCLTSDDGSKLFMITLSNMLLTSSSSVLLIDNDGLHGSVRKCSDISVLYSDSIYSFDLEYWERGGGALVRLEWKVPGSDTYTIIPPNAWV